MFHAFMFDVQSPLSKGSEENTATQLRKCDAGQADCTISDITSSRKWKVSRDR